MTLSELKARMTLAEFRQWLAYAQLDPYGLDRGDYQAALVAAATLNAFRGRDADPVQPADLMPRWGEAPSQPAAPTGPTLAQIQALIARVNSAVAR